MKLQKLYSNLTPYLVISMLALGISSLSVNATGHKNAYHNPSDGHHDIKQRDNQHVTMKNRLHRLAKNLDLTPEQRSEVKEIFSGMKAVRQAYKSTMSGFKEQVQSLMQRPEFVENQFEIIYLEHQANFQKMAMEKAKIRHKVMQLLTAEQQQKFLIMRY
tara:strand:- start:320 stop:799 length:480 start_codon:yes stop_codon:yes gene_type:complete